MGQLRKEDIFVRLKACEYTGEKDRFCSSCVLECLPALVNIGPVVGKIAVAAVGK